MLTQEHALLAKITVTHMLQLPVEVFSVLSLSLSLSLFPTSTYSLRRCRKVEKVKPCGKCQVMAWIAFQSLAPLCRPRLFILTGWGPVAVAEGDGQGFAFPVCNHYVPESNCILVPFHYATLRGLKSHFTVAPL